MSPKIGAISASRGAAALARSLAALTIFACGSPAGGQFFGLDGAGGQGGDGGLGGQGGASSVTATTTSTATTASSSSTTVSSTTAASTSTTGAGGATSSTTTGGDLCGNALCDPGEDVTCPQDCFQGCAHAFCATGDALTLGCDPCVDLVCNSDFSCCNNAWGGQCVALADSLCGAGCCGNDACDGEDCNSCPQDCGVCPPPPTCAHSSCEVAGPLDTALCTDPCVSTICASMPECCGGPNWNGDCTVAALAACDEDPCVSAVCAQSPSCCAVAWTQACVDLAVAAAACGMPTCACAHPICTGGGGVLAATCDPCVAAVCAVDNYCCVTDWDGICVGEVATICDIDCN